MQGKLDPDQDDLALSKDAAQQGYAKLREVQDIYARLRIDLEGDKFWRYERQVSPGLQEYIEALSFAHYLDHGTLITFGEVQNTLRDLEGVEVSLLTRSCEILTLRMLPVFPVDGVRLSPWAL